MVRQEADDPQTVETTRAETDQFLLITTFPPPCLEWSDSLIHICGMDDALPWFFKSKALSAISNTVNSFVTFQETQRMVLTLNMCISCKMWPTIGMLKCKKTICSSRTCVTLILLDADSCGQFSSKEPIVIHSPASVYFYVDVSPGL